MPDAFKLLTTIAIVVLGAGFVVSDDSSKGGGKVFPQRVHKKTLPNGLKMVVIPFDSPGLVSYWTVVRAGSRNEVEPGKSGFAHFFEHMMFRGTERYSSDRFNEILKELGADNNAFTTDDYTAYHTLASSDSLETLMTIEADRFMNLKYSVEDFKKEAGAVLGEYNKNASSPFLLMHERLREAAFTEHTYKHTTMGFLDDIKDMPNQYEYSLEFFDRFYRPENCILLVVGDVEPGDVFEKARAHYGAWEKGDYKFEVPAEPAQKKEKRVELDWPNPTQPFLYIGYHAPAFSTTSIDLPALDLISQLLFAEAAPLHQRLVVEEQVVDLLSGGAQDHRDPYLFTIVARVKDPEKLEHVETTITKALEALGRETVAEDRLERVKSHMKYSFAMSLDTAGSVAGTMAHYLAMTGDVESVNEVYAQYERLTPKDVRTIAKKYFVSKGRTVVMLQHGNGAESGSTAGGATTGGSPTAAASHEEVR